MPPPDAFDGIRLPQMASDRLRLLRWPQVAKFRNIGTTVFQNSGCQHFATSWNSKIHKYITNTVRVFGWDNCLEFCPPGEAAQFLRPWFLHASFVKANSMLKLHLVHVLRCHRLSRQCRSRFDTKCDRGRGFCVKLI